MLRFLDARPRTQKRLSQFSHQQFQKSVRRDYHQSFAQPDFHAPAWRISAYSPVFKTEKGPQKNCTEPRYACRSGKIGKIPAPIKIKLALPPPPSRKTQHPPLEGGILWALGFSSRKNQKMPGDHKIGSAISGPRIAGRKIMDTTLILIKLPPKSSPI